MTSIDPKEAASALSDINEIAHRVRQSTIYDCASLMLIMWGVLVLSGNIASYLWPREGGYIWLALNVVGLAGSLAIGIFESRRTSVHSFDLRMVAAFLLFFAFGFLWSIGLGHFTPRQLGVFWPTYFMMVYTVVGLWVGLAFVDRARHHGADVDRLFLCRRLVRSMDGRGQRRRAYSRRPLDAPELERWPSSTTSSTSHCG